MLKRRVASPEQPSLDGKMVRHQDILGMRDVILMICTRRPYETPSLTMYIATVAGVGGGVGYANGTSYSSLAPDKIAHTFTISQLHINVPLPGDANNGASTNTVTFTFHTGKAGTYTFQCFDPCGQGPSGWEGAMSMKGYMMGTLVVQ